jgi:hypothetical protein
MSRPDEWTETILIALGIIQKRLYWIGLGVWLVVLLIGVPLIAKQLGISLWWTS